MAMIEETEGGQVPLHVLQYVHVTTKRTKKFFTGNDCFILTDEKNVELLSKSCDEIFYSSDDICIPQEIMLMFYVHDIDWLAVVFFNDKSLKSKFFDFLEKHSKLVLESSIDLFYD